jgi:5,10-methylenetetrahydromethanopterin reductase
VPVLREWTGSPSVGIVVGAVTVVDEDGARARAAARTEVAMYVDVVGARDPTAPIEPELRERIRALVASGDEQEAGALLSDDVLSRFAFAGTPAEVAEQAEALFDAGASRIDFGTPHGIDEPHGVDLLCREVLPRLRLA